MSALIACLLAIFPLRTLAVTPPPPLESRQYPTTSTKSPLAYPKQRGPGYDYTSFTPNQTARAEAVIEQFRFAWAGYYEYAFPHDDLLPTNNSFSDSRNGWGLTAIDALDTAIIMQQTDIVAVILDYVPTIDFTRNNAAAPDPVSTSLFESNIRYIGGLLGAYDLLKGPFRHLGFEGEQVEVLLRQARSLADTLKFAFDTPTGIPVNTVYIGNRSFAESNKMADGTYSAGLAELGTLVLEVSLHSLSPWHRKRARLTWGTMCQWQHLSDLTGDPSYGDLAQKAESYWFDGAEVWPGLTGGNFSVETGEIIDQYGGWTSGNDSAYEYLIKMCMLTQLHQEFHAAVH